jgi:regulator of replication initiation timing
MMFHVELRDGKKKQKNKKKKKKKKYSSYSMLFKLSLHKTHVCDLLLGLDRGQKEL